MTDTPDFYSAIIADMRPTAETLVRAYGALMGHDAADSVAWIANRAGQYARDWKGISLEAVREENPTIELPYSASNLRSEVYGYNPDVTGDEQTILDYSVELALRVSHLYRNLDNASGAPGTPGVKNALTQLLALDPMLFEELAGYSRWMRQTAEYQGVASDETLENLQTVVDQTIAVQHHLTDLRGAQYQAQLEAEQHLFDIRDTLNRMAVNLSDYLGFDDDADLESVHAFLEAFEDADYTPQHAIDAVAEVTGSAPEEGQAVLGILKAVAVRLNFLHAKAREADPFATHDQPGAGALNGLLAAHTDGEWLGKHLNLLRTAPPEHGAPAAASRAASAQTASETYENDPFAQWVNDRMFDLNQFEAALPDDAARTPAEKLSRLIEDAGALAQNVGRLKAVHTIAFPQQNGRVI